MSLPAEATEFLSYIVPNNTEDRAVRKKLARRLNFFPLAIVQATAFIRQRQIPLSAYTEKLESSQERGSGSQTVQSKILAKAFYAFHHNGSMPPQSLITTWDISYRQILQNNPHAARLLEVFSLFCFNDILEQVFNLTL